MARRTTSPKPAEQNEHVARYGEPIQVRQPGATIEDTHTLQGAVNPDPAADDDNAKRSTARTTKRAAPRQNKRG
jgi:hypothetical protein